MAVSWSYARAVKIFSRPKTSLSIKDPKGALERPSPMRSHLPQCSPQLCSIPPVCPWPSRLLPPATRALPVTVILCIVITCLLNLFLYFVFRNDPSFPAMRNCPDDLFIYSPSIPTKREGQSHHCFLVVSSAFFLLSVFSFIFFFFIYIELYVIISMRHLVIR